MTDYKKFLETKQIIDKPTGLTSIPEINPQLFDFQRDIVKWSLRRGRSCIFTDCGLGKTPMQLEWSKHIPGNILIVAPLAVSHQTIREGYKFGIQDIVYSKHGEINSKITITNYERLEHFDASLFNGIVLDESSILKSYSGKYRNMIIDKFKDTPFKLACTATPAPNDHMELANHAEFLQVMSRPEMLATFFVHDGGSTSQWRLKGHAVKAFWEWVASWAVMMAMPSDLGYEDNGFKLPPMEIEQIVVDRTGYIVKEAQTLQDRRRARTDSLELRVAAAKKLILDM